MDRYRDRIAIEFISALGMPPIDYIRLAADLRCRQIGIALEPIVANTKAYPKWSLRNDSVLRRETVAALRDNGVSVLLGEGFLIWPNKDIRNASADLDLMVELGAKRVNVLSLDPDRGRTIDQCGIFAEQASARDLDATLEFLPGMPVHDLPSALDVVRQVNRPNFRVLIDAMHFFRSGSDLTQLSVLDPSLIGHVQLCDVPLQSKYTNYADEARYDRLQPGEGELPLLDLLVALPADSIIGLEVPMLAKAEAGIGPRQYLSGCIEAASALLKQADALRASRNA
jgi:sugar phosphate isomerase/epimerase